MIPFFVTHISKTANEQVGRVLDSTLLSEGKLVSDFEKEIEQRLGIKNAVAVNSGTSALHLGLVCGCIQPGDEVILPSQTFIASGLSIFQAGAVPVFADIQYETGNLDPNSIREHITSRTRAIMPVHWGGTPCDMDEIQQIAGENGLWVIEDAAHALGAGYKGRPVGSISRFTAFSFQAIKHLTTGDGGLLSCLHVDDYDEARRRRWFGINRAESPMSFLGEREYDVSDIGYKYHMNDYAAALGLANLEDLDFILARRREIAARYRSALKNVVGVQLLKDCNDRKSASWLFNFHVEKRESFIRALKDRGIPASVVHLGIHKYSVFNQQNKHLPNQSRFDQSQISIPVHQKLGDDDVQMIIEAIQKGW